MWEGEHGWDGYSTVDLGEGPSERRPTGEEGLSAKSAGGVVRHYSGSSDGRSSVGKDRSTERLSPTPFPQSPSNIGLGQPSSRPIKPRSTSSSRPTVPQTYTSTPRSASMNMLSSPSTSVSSSRLGVAAHFVPPESSYTPSRGANWDEVVLPTVAKKLGLGFLAGNGSSEGEEGDLAVEWDRFGTPVKWIKGSTVRRMEGVPGGLNVSFHPVPVVTFYIPFFSLTQISLRHSNGDTLHRITAHRISTSQGHCLHPILLFFFCPKPC